MRSKFPPLKETIRWILAIGSVLLVLYIAPLTICWYSSTFVYVDESNPVIIPNRPYNELVDGGIQSKTNLSNNLFQATLLLAAAVAGLLIAKDGEAKFVLALERPNAPEIIMFTCTSILLLLSFTLHGLYLNEVSYIYSVAGKEGIFKPADPKIPDVFNDNVNFLFTYQLWCLLGGTALTFATFFSAHKLREREGP